MTNHRKILEGVSEGPWYRIHDPEDLPVLPGIGEFDQLGDADFAVHARNHWESICDLIDAVDEYRKADEETNKCTELLVFDPCGPKAAEIMQAMYKAKDELFAALDKLNGQEEK